MLSQMTDEQLVHHLVGLGQWAKIRAQELKYFTEHLQPQQLQAAPGSAQSANLQYALATYIGGVEEIMQRCREAEAELGRRLAQKAVS